VQGFELEALDYLLKPIAFERFLKAAQKARLAVTPPPAALPSAAPEASEADYVFVKTESKGKMAKVDFVDIVYIEGLKNYVAAGPKFHAGAQVLPRFARQDSGPRWQPDLPEGHQYLRAAGRHLPLGFSRHLASDGRQEVAMPV
jgi:hypothetical protein